MQRIKVRVEGTRPLLMHRLPIDFEGRGRSGEKHEPKDDAEKALYRDKEGRIVVPSRNILSCLRVAARDYRVPGKGKRSFKDYIYSGVLVEPAEFIPLVCGDGKGPEEAWEIDLQPVVVQRARIIRARPRFDEWALEFELLLVDPIIRPENLQEMLASAGQYIGLCDARPLFGLFRVAEFVVAE